MSTSFYTAIFFIVFILFLAESIYYLNKKERGNTPDKSVQTKNPNLLFKIVIPIISVVIIIIAISLFVSSKKNLPAGRSSSSFPSPTSSEISKIVSSPAPTITSIQISLSPTLSKEKLTPTISLPSSVPTPAKSSAPIVYPKMPLAGSFRQTIIYALGGFLSLIAGLLL